MTKFEAARAAHNATKAKLGCLRSRGLVVVMQPLGPQKGSFLEGKWDPLFA